MEFLILAGLGFAVLLLLKPQSPGAMTGQSIAVKSTIAQGKDVFPSTFQAPALLAMGHATFGTDRNPATIGLTPENIGQGSQFPVAQQSLGISGFNLTTMFDSVRSLLDSGLPGQPSTSPSGGTPSTGAVSSAVGVGPQSNATLYPPPSNGSALSSGQLPISLAYASPNSPQTGIVGNNLSSNLPKAQVIPPTTVGSPTNAPIPVKTPIVPSGPNIPVGSSTAVIGIAPSTPIAPFQVAVVPPAQNPLYGASVADQSAYPTQVP